MLNINANLTREQSNEAWCKMKAALELMIEKGYDCALATSILPVVDDRRINPVMRDVFWYGYLHIKHRLDPKWALSEPIEIVDACCNFVDGFDTLFSKQVCSAEKKSKETL